MIIKSDWLIKKNHGKRWELIFTDLPQFNGLTKPSHNKKIPPSSGIFFDINRHQSTYLRTSGMDSHLWHTNLPLMKYMKVLFVFAFTLIAVTCMGQTFSITGSISDETGVALPFANAA